MTIHKDLGRLAAALAASAILGNCGLLHKQEHKGSIKGYEVEVHHLEESYLRVVMSSTSRNSSIKSIEAEVFYPEYISGESPFFLINSELKKSEGTMCTVSRPSLEVPECSDSDYIAIEKLSRQAADLFHPVD